MADSICLPNITISQYLSDLGITNPEVQYHEDSTAVCADTSENESICMLVPNDSPETVFVSYSDREPYFRFRTLWEDQLPAGEKDRDTVEILQSVLDETNAAVAEATDYLERQVKENDVNPYVLTFDNEPTGGSPSPISCPQADKTYQLQFGSFRDCSRFLTGASFVDPGMWVDSNFVGEENLAFSILPNFVYPNYYDLVVGPQNTDVPFAKTDDVLKARVYAPADDEEAVPLFESVDTLLSNLTERWGYADTVYEAGTLMSP